LCYFSGGSLKDFKEFADAVESIKDNGVVVAVASPDDVEAANKEKPVFPEVKKCLWGPFGGLLVSFFFFFFLEISSSGLHQTPMTAKPDNVSM